MTSFTGKGTLPMEEKQAFPFSEDDVRWLYRLLNHAGYATVVHCQNGKVVVDRRLVYAEQELVEWAAAHNGRGNLYVGRNPRQAGRDDSVSAVSSFSFDLDPERPVGAVASDGGRAAALRVSRTLMGICPGGALVDSGNGYQIIYSWAPKENVNVEEFGRKSKAFLEQTERLLVGVLAGVKLDRIHDPERLIRLPGTVNVKGGRLARFVAPPVATGQGESVFARIVAQSIVPLQREATERIARPLTDEIQSAARALGQLKLSRADDYQNWLNVGMSLRSLGDCGLQLWEEWSRKSPRFQEGVCAEKWGTFEPGEPGEDITLGSLIAWAREDAAGSPKQGQQGFSAAGSGNSAFSFSTGELLSYAKDVSWLVPGLIPVQGAIIVGGQEGVGKSWLALDLAVSASRGLPWLGALPTRASRVLYLDEESSPQLLKRRLSRLLKGQEAPGAEALEFRVGAGVNFSDPLWLDSFAESLRRKPVDLVIVDSLVRSHRGEENSSTELAKIFGAVKRLISDHGISMLFLDHESKAAMGLAADGESKREPSTRDLRGSNEKGAFCDSILLAKRVGPQLALHHVKSRWSEAAEPFMVRVFDTPEGATLVRKEG